MKKLQILKLWKQILNSYKMNKEELEKRIVDIKKENDELNESLVVLDQERQQLIQKAIINNGRILELEDLIKQFN